MKMNDVCDYLDYLFPNPKCELLFNKDYEFLIAIVLSAQSTDKRVNSVMPLILSKYNTLEKLMNADSKDLETIIRPVGSFRKKSSYILDIAKMLVENYGGVVPRDREELIKFPGVGRKSANVVMLEAFGDAQGIAVDTHCKRISNKIGNGTFSLALKIEYSNSVGRISW